jgi:imidazolonepropionase-like amidohydrolase
MNKPAIVTALVLLSTAACTTAPPAADGSQGIVITNARIVTGVSEDAQGVFPQGSVFVKDGKIVSVSAGAAKVPDGAQVIDGTGMTVMPGFIDAHRHIIQGDPVQWMSSLAKERMQEFLDAGFTTVLSCGDAMEQILDLRGKLKSGEIQGPTLYAAAFMQLARPTPPPPGAPRVDPARTDVSRPPDRPTKAAVGIPAVETLDTVQKLAKAGIDAFKAVITVTPGGPEKATLSLIVTEAHKLGLPSITHAVSVIDTLAAVEAKTDILVHTPHIGQLTPAEVKTIADSRIPMMSTLGVFTPTFAEGNQRVRDRKVDDNQPRFRDLDPFPMNTLSSAGQGPVNARMLYDAGLPYGYGTDTTFLPKDSLAHELKPLQLVFSNKDIIKIMTRNAAAVLGPILAKSGAGVGTLEVGKNADLVLIAGNPIEDIRSVLNVKAVIKAGKLVVDKR